MQKKELGITQSKIAEGLKPEIETISCMENGKISLCLNRQEQFVLISKCSPADLLRPAPKNNNEILNAMTDAIIPLKQDKQKFILNFMQNISSL